MPLADARAQLPALNVAEADLAADADLLATLARRMLRLTPTVMQDAPDGLLLDIGASAHLFGGTDALIARLRARLLAMGLSVRHGLASNPEAARAFARFGRPALDEGAAIRALPVQALALPDEAVQGLRRLGLKRVADLATRPRAGLTARFGSDAALALARLLGELPSPLTPDVPAPVLRFVTRLPEPILATEQAMLLLEELLVRACRQLERLHAGGLRFEAGFSRTDGMVHRLCVAASSPLREPLRIMRLFHEHMDSLRDPLDPGFGFDAIALFIPQHAPLAPSAVTFETGVEPQGVKAQLVDQLAARFGDQNIRRFLARDTHIPERASAMLPAGVAASAAGWPAPAAGEPPRRPILLFDPPQPIEVLAEVPDGPPHRFRWRRCLHQVRLAEGPERIAGEWWRHAPGRRAATRDYYRVEDSDGRRFWLFRNGLYTEMAVPDWYIHGLFA